MSRTLRFGMAASRAWTAFYTAGLSDLVRSRRRAEIESDVWEQRTFAVQNGSAEVDVGFDILVRTLLGMPADLMWRSATRAGIETPRKGASTMLIKFFAAVATVASIAFGALFIFVALGRAPDGGEAFAAPLLAAGLAVLGGGIAAFWSPRIGTALVGAGSALIVFTFPWMAGGTLPIAVLLVLGTLARGRMPRPGAAA